ncbi:hypothetical protein CMO89_02130 [Candidatus Woesearchaeota archaeon]|nr:hypothetical protein [Candidatus Woesearchaeota archaeon]|tara:strand:- start:14827 stop:15153 length:327 start_codon:yes stop_codon:yes gene_type:complete
MNKILLVLVIIETIAIIYLLTDEITFPTGFVVKEVIENYTPEENNTENDSMLVFSTYTKAVCKDKQDHTICNDRIFVKCGDIEYTLPDVLNNSIIVKGDWIDPRMNKT